MVAHQDQDKKGGTSPLHTPKGLRDAKKDYAAKYGRAQDGTFRYGYAVADINPAEQKEAA